MDFEARRQRLDVALVERRLARSRAQARDLVRRGLVMVDGLMCGKPGAIIGSAQTLGLAGSAGGFVSRGAEKLRVALVAFAFDPAGRIALDIGAATGGFTQVLLDAGARRVYAVDVGHDQLHERLRADDRVVPLDRLDARRLTTAIIGEPVGALVADVSFVSLTKVLPAALALAARSAWLVVLVKPQFEAGRDAVGKGGIVRDPTARARAVDATRAWMAAQPGWTVVGVIPSPIAGGSGNAEYLLGARRDG